MPVSGMLANRAMLTATRCGRRLLRDEREKRDGASGRQSRTLGGGADGGGPMTDASASDDPAPPGAAAGRTITKLFDGKGGARDIPADRFTQEALGSDPDSFAWQHLIRDHPDTGPLLAAARLDAFVVDALTAEETRPRCTVHDEGVLLNLRGVNLHPSAEPGDMVSVRFWIEAHRIIGVSVRPLDAIADLMAAAERGLAPRSPGDLVAKLALRLADRAEPAVADLNERIDQIEEQLIDGDTQVPRADLAHVRRVAILLRRYMSPQRDALTTLEIEDIAWLTERDRAHLREAADRVLRLGEELDSIRDRAQIVHDQLLDQRAESLNRRMLLLSVVAAVFLPLSLVTGLLGMNVGGIPGTQSPAAFAIICISLVVVGVAVAIYFRVSGMLK